MEKVHVKPFTIIGIHIRTTNQNGQAVKEIGELWEKFISKNILEKIPNKIDDTIYSIYTDYEGDHTQPYSTILGCRVKSLDSIPNGMVGKVFDGGNYIKTTAKGDLANGLIVIHWSKIFDMNLNRAYIADFETFGEKAQDPSDAEVDFYVGVND